MGSATSTPGPIGSDGVTAPTPSEVEPVEKRTAEATNAGSYNPEPSESSPLNEAEKVISDGDASIPELCGSAARSLEPVSDDEGEYFSDNSAEVSEANIADDEAMTVPSTISRMNELDHVGIDEMQRDAPAFHELIDASSLYPPQQLAREAIVRRHHPKRYVWSVLQRRPSQNGSAQAYLNIMKEDARAI
ncbi:unnamed protein product [Phytophthora fragariaefolia]|uniref:Unnamed protein product n=1 Tax=Phytophthora fragariaefolia TaxID=1490495 RepID=A0A9W6U0Q0_9STRA|nr:unnamed protein product [Phytophthora fragariaefolia]